MTPADLAKVFKALADPARVQIIRKLASPECSGSFRCASSGLNLTQPSKSHHFGVLVDAEVITEHRDGRRKYYQLNRHTLQTAGIDIAALKHKEQLV